MRPIALPRLPGAPFDGYALHVHGTLEAVRARWQDALEHGAGYLFQTWEWNRMWQQTVGQAQGVLPRIVELRDPSGATVALWPLGIYRRHGLRVLDFLGEVMSDYRAPVLRTGFPGALPAGAFAALWTAIACGVDGVDLVQMRRMPHTLEPPDSTSDTRAAHGSTGEASNRPRPAGVPNPMAQLPGAVHTENAYAAHLPESLSRYDQRFSARRLSDMRRRLRQLSELGPVRIEPCHAGSEHPEVIRVLAEQKSRRWRETGSRDLFAEPGYLAFYEQLAFEPDTPASVSVASIQVGDAVVATHWGAVFRGRYYWLLPTYAEGDWSRYSCGRSLLHAMVGWSIEQGLAVFDLTVGDEAYKQDWADHSMALYAWSRPRTVRGAAVLALQGMKAWAREQAALRRLLGKPPLQPAAEAAARQ